MPTPFVRTVCTLATAVFLLTSAVATPAPAGAQSAQIRRFVGIYEATINGADSQQHVIMELDPGGRAVMTTEYPGYSRTAAGVRVLPQLEKGLWSVANQYAIVHFVRRANILGKDRNGETKHDAYKPEDIALTFSLGFRCVLKLERDDKSIFGKSGLRLQGKGC